MTFLLMSLTLNTHQCKFNPADSMSGVIAFEATHSHPIGYVIEYN